MQLLVTPDADVDRPMLLLPQHQLLLLKQLQCHQHRSLIQVQAFPVIVASFRPVPATFAE
ncbi:MAG TPA: hypothetical protein DDX19_23500 [Rhodopirellula baltica]|nr:hypothetical protein [Rhodopirellula baltica]